MGRAADIKRRTFDMWAQFWPQHNDMRRAVNTATRPALIQNPGNYNSVTFCRQLRRIFVLLCPPEKIQCAGSLSILKVNATLLLSAKTQCRRHLSCVCWRCWPSPLSAPSPHKPKPSYTPSPKPEECIQHLA